MADKMFENNQVSLVGEIVSDFQFSHEVYGEGFYTFKVCADRLSDNFDVLPITVSEILTCSYLKKRDDYFYSIIKSLEKALALSIISAFCS